MPVPSNALLRIVKGQPDAEELAAILIVLLTRTAAAGHHRRDAPGRRHHIEHVPRFRAPHSWQSASR